MCESEHDAAAERTEGDVCVASESELRRNSNVNMLWNRCDLVTTTELAHGLCKSDWFAFFFVFFRLIKLYFQSRCERAFSVAFHCVCGFFPQSRLIIAKKLKIEVFFVLLSTGAITIQSAKMSSVKQARLHSLFKCSAISDVMIHISEIVRMR